MMIRRVSYNYHMADTARLSLNDLEGILGDEASLLTDTSTCISRDALHLPGSDVVDRLIVSDRSNPVLGNLQRLFSQGRLGGTGYLSILPVDQGIEHSAIQSFSPNPDYFDPENVVRLAMQAGCSGVASTLGALASVSRRYAHLIPFIVKINHNELLTFPNDHDQTMFARVQQAWDLGAVAVGATIYFGSQNSRRQIIEVGEAFQAAHQLGMATVLWCYLRNNAFKVDEKDYHAAADLTGQANHLGATIGADILKQKLPILGGGYKAVQTKKSSYGATDAARAEQLATESPIDLARLQVAHGYMGRIPLINSGGPFAGDSDIEEAIKTAVINKRAGGSGLIAGRKAFQRPLQEGVDLINKIQDVYLLDEVTIA